VLEQVANAYKTNPVAHNRFDIRGAFPHDGCILSVYADQQEVSIWTLDLKTTVDVGSVTATRWATTTATCSNRKSEPDLVSQVPEIVENRAAVGPVRLLLQLSLGCVPEFLDQLGDYFRLRRSSELRF
jgi:hypothetical protein